MEQLWLESGLTLLLVLTVIVFWSVKSQYRAPHLPPGPFAWPVVGNLLQLGTQPHRSLAKWSRKYGPLMRVKFGSVETVVVSSPVMAKEIFQTHDLACSSRPKLVAGEVVFYNSMDVAFAPMGPQWRKSRKIMKSELLNSGRIASFQWQRVRKEEMLASLNSAFQASSTGRPIQFNRAMYELTFNVISRMMTNKKYFGVDINLGEAEELENCINEYFKLAGLSNLGDFMPALQRFDLQGIRKRLQAIHKRFDTLLQAVIDDHRATANAKRVDDEDENMDFVHAVMNLSTADGQNQLPDAEMKALILDVIFAGTDTQATTLEWTFTELFRHPKELSKVQEELDRVVGRERLVEESDVPNLSYLKNIFKEVFRLHPTGPFLVPRESIEACKISGYDIPAKTMMICNIWAIGRDSTIWGEDVEEFKPQRFEKLPNVDWKGHNFELIPFGSGRRICPGLDFAELLMHCTMAQWIHAFSWALPPGKEKEDINTTECYGMTLTKSVPLEMVATPRLRPHVYKVANIDIGVC